MCDLSGLHILTAANSSPAVESHFMKVTVWFLWWSVFWLLVCEAVVIKEKLALDGYRVHGNNDPHDLRLLVMFHEYDLVIKYLKSSPSVLSEVVLHH